MVGWVKIFTQKTLRQLLNDYRRDTIMNAIKSTASNLRDKCSIFCMIIVI